MWQLLMLLALMGDLERKSLDFTATMRKNGGFTINKWGIMGDISLIRAWTVQQNQDMYVHQT
jgi:hypothetical protein